MTILDSKNHPGQVLRPVQLYGWYSFSSSEPAHAFRGNGSAGVRSVCGWQRWAVTMAAAGSRDPHCRDCMVVVEHELAEALVLSQDPETERRMRAAALIADEADDEPGDADEAAARLRDQISGERRDWFRVEVDPADLAAILDGPIRITRLQADELDRLDGRA
jgi:hypothetical protein